MERLLGPVTIIERAPGRFSIAGELDMATARRLDKLAAGHGQLLLDLHGVTFMDSNGIAALVRLYKRCQKEGCTFQIEACSRPVERVLRIINLYDIFTEDGARRRAEAGSCDAIECLELVDLDVDERGAS